MQCRIEFVDDLMTIVDQNGDGYDAHIVEAVGRDEAERKIDEWAGTYRFDVARAKRELRALIKQM